MVKTLEKDLEEVYGYSPKWKKDMHDTIWSAFGSEKSEITEANIEKLLGIVHGDGVKHIVEEYLGGQTGELSDKVLKNLSRMAYQFLPSAQEIKDQFKGKVVNATMINAWIDSLENRLDQSLFRHVLSDVPHAPLGDVIELTKRMGGKAGVELNYDNIIKESADALPLLQRFSNMHRERYRIQSEYGAK